MGSFKKRFNTIKIDRSTVIWKDGMEIEAYIAGVNSGAYQLPFAIRVKTWAKKWFFKKFFVRTMELNYYEIKQLRDELNKAIELYDENLKPIKDEI